MSRNFYTPEQRKDRQRNADLRCYYGIDLEDYRRMLAEQAGLCAICCQPPKQGKVLGVDHYEPNGEKVVRGLLCDPCNMGLGQFRDNIDSLVRAARYLTPHAVADTWAAALAEVG